MPKKKNPRKFSWKQCIKKACVYLKKTKKGAAFCSQYHQRLDKLRLNFCKWDHENIEVLKAQELLAKGVIHEF